MTQQTGNDRYAGTMPPREEQQAPPADAGGIMHQGKQAGMQMDQQNDRGQQNERREQAGQQSDRSLAGSNRDSSDNQPGEAREKGFGYGAQEGEEMADAPDTSERGYGGASEKREEKIEKED